MISEELQQIVDKFKEQGKMVFLEAATYIQNNFQYHIAYGEENEYRLKKTLFDCDNVSVRKVARQVYYNSPEIYV